MRDAHFLPSASETTLHVKAIKALTGRRTEVLIAVGGNRQGGNCVNWSWRRFGWCPDLQVSQGGCLRRSEASAYGQNRDIPLGVCRMS